MGKEFLCREPSLCQELPAAVLGRFDGRAPTVITAGLVRCELGSVPRVAAPSSRQRRLVPCVRLAPRLSAQRSCAVSLALGSWQSLILTAQARIPVVVALRCKRQLVPTKHVPQCILTERANRSATKGTRYLEHLKRSLETFRRKFTSKERKNIHKKWICSKTF
jgi:hypothetical protein